MAASNEKYSIERTTMPICNIVDIERAYNPSFALLFKINRYSRRSVPFITFITEIGK